MEPTNRPRRCPDHRVYLRGCTPCRAWAAWYKRQSKLDAARGIRRRVSPEPARAHIARLTEAGMTRRSIARLSGVSPRAVLQLAEGRTRFARADIADAILGVRYRRGWQLIDGTGVRRMLQALSRIGHTRAELAAGLGVSGARVLELLHTRRVTLEVHDRVQTLYDRLSMTPGTSRRTVRESIAAGWVSPLAWDDDTINDPAAQPALDTAAGGQDDVDSDQDVDDGKVWLAIGGDGVPWRQLNTAEKTAAVTDLATRYTDETIAARLRCTREAIAKWRERYEIPAYIPSGRFDYRVELVGAA